MIVMLLKAVWSLSLDYYYNRNCNRFSGPDVWWRNQLSRNSFKPFHDKYNSNFKTSYTTI